MLDIHPTAIVDPGAVLGAGVTVGPYTIIDGNVTIGDDTHLGPHVIVRPYTSIGKRCRIFQFAVVGEIPQDLKFQGEETRLIIGDDNIIREFATLHRGTMGGGGLTQVGNGNLLMAYTHVAHDCRLGNNIIMSNLSTLAGHITVDDYAILGGLVRHSPVLPNWRPCLYWRCFGRGPRRSAVLHGHRQPRQDCRSEFSRAQTAWI